MDAYINKIKEVGAITCPEPFNPYMEDSKNIPQKNED